MHMNMDARLRAALAAAVLSTVAVAQVGFGDKAPPAAWRHWLQGEPTAFAGEAAAPCTVLAFYARPGLAAQFASDGDYLASLQRRFADRGLAVVAVVNAPDAQALANWPGCRVAADDEGELTNAWLGAADGPWHVVVLDKRGRVVLLGTPESGLVDAIEATLRGEDVIAPTARASAIRVNMQVSFDDAIAADTVRALEDVLTTAPRDGLSFGLLYVTQATKRNDAGEASKVLQRASKVLADEARPLAVFADLAMRGDPGREGLATTLVPLLEVASKQTRHDVTVQLAYLRALVQAGLGREVGRHAIAVRKLVVSSASSCLDFATLLTQDKDAPVHRDLATMALDKAATLGALPRLLTAARYGVAVRCAGDTAAAKKLLDAYLEEAAAITINNDCWYMMTELATMGRYDAFAAGLAERMLEQRDSMDGYEFDTAALAMFLAGRVDEAVALQETAIDKGGKGNPEYTERLQRYKARLAPAPR
jgi:hypothetical protein